MSWWVSPACSTLATRPFSRSAATPRHCCPPPAAVLTQRCPRSLARLLAFAIGAGCAGLAGAVYAGLVGSIEPDEFDFTVSLMVLAAVVIGGRWGVTGVAIGALVVAAYDRLLVGALEDGLHALGATLGIPGLLSIDVRGENFAVFGLALYLATLAQLRGPARGSAGDLPVE